MKAPPVPTDGERVSEECPDMVVNIHQGEHKKVGRDKLASHLFIVLLMLPRLPLRVPFGRGVQLSRDGQGTPGRRSRYGWCANGGRI